MTPHPPDPRCRDLYAEPSHDLRGAQGAEGSRRMGSVLPSCPMQPSHCLSRPSGSQQTSLLPSFGAAPRELCLCPLTYGHGATGCTLVPRGHFPSLLAQIKFPSCWYQQTGRGLNGKGAGSARGTGRTDPGVCWFLVRDSKEECDGDARWRFSATCRAPDAPEVTNLPSSAGASRFTKAYAEFTHVCQGSLTFPHEYLLQSPKRI